LPQTPALVQPVHPAVCSHWKQNILFDAFIFAVFVIFWLIFKSS
jgi:hypothetical protein